MVKLTEKVIYKFYQMLLRKDENRIERREISVSFSSLRFLRRGLLRNYRTSKSKSSIIAVKLYLLIFLISITFFYSYLVVQINYRRAGEKLIQFHLKLFFHIPIMKQQILKTILLNLIFLNMLINDHLKMLYLFHLL